MPVAASTSSAMCAPPTRADVSRKYTRPSSRPMMYSVCDTPRCRPKRLQDPFVLGQQPTRGIGIALQNARGENAASLRDFEGRRAVRARDGKADLPFVHDGVDVKDIAGDKTLQQVVGLLVAKSLHDLPEFAA